ncbi:MAG: glycoside hydrolase family 43 protein [Prevotellaceae bacterium]|jgi:alpha-N-arabinofuranosidase|nr:glycoside hydrolase family 43 protein [Prevotellaceae bacterium]
MKKVFLYFGFLMIFIIPCSSQNTGYENPVISGFYPDPSVCRVGKDYYLVNSTFQFFPGVPIFHSTDLVNWEQIGNCLTREAQINLKTASTSGGIYAPTIRYHEGVFYMITTNVSDKGNFFVWTDNPRGEWSDPVWLEQGSIDPSLFFDNGKCYMTSGGVSMCEIDPKTGKQLTPSRKIWEGTGGRYPEGSHIYKKDDWYYLLIAEGGTEYGHQVTISRSRDIYGPYEGNPANPILTHINRNAQNSPIQGVGHAELVAAHNGSWWILCHGFRPQAGMHHVLGRETMLVPVTWEKNAWPVANGDGTVELEMTCATLPQLPPKEKASKTLFDTGKLGFEWNYLYNPTPSMYSLNRRAGRLSLKPSTISLDDKGSPTFVGRRQQHIECIATTSVELSNCNGDEKAGLTVYMDNEYHYDLFVKPRKGGKQAVSLYFRLGNLRHTAKELPVPAGKVYLQVRADKNYYSFYYSVDNINFNYIDKMNIRFLSSETAGGFTGVYFGMYAVSSKNTNGYADFEWFEYKNSD